VGISLVETKAIVFMIAGFIAGVGGALLVEAQQFVSVNQLPLIGGLSIILSLVVFGVGTTSGPLIAGLMAAAFAVISSNWLQGNWGDTLTVVGPALAALGQSQQFGAVAHGGEDVSVDRDEHRLGEVLREVGRAQDRPVQARAADLVLRGQPDLLGRRVQGRRHRGGGHEDARIIPVDELCRSRFSRRSNRERRLMLTAMSPPSGFSSPCPTLAP